LRLGRTVSAAGPSLLETLEGFLFDTMQKWRETEEYTDVKHNLRGQVRGLARAIAKIRLPYEDQRIVTKRIEKEFLRKVKENG
jgi:hypothetical protein